MDGPAFEGVPSAGSGRLASVLHSAVLVLGLCVLGRSKFYKREGHSPYLASLPPVPSQLSVCDQICKSVKTHHHSTADVSAYQRSAAEANSGAAFEIGADDLHPGGGTAAQHARRLLDHH
eukprot:1160218-Pelagomonas_calceolata.AAC.6